MFSVVIIECITVWFSVLLLHYCSLLLSCLWMDKCSLEVTLFLCLDDIAQNNFLWRYHKHCNNGTSAPFSFAKIIRLFISTWASVGISVFVSFILTNNHQIDIYLCFILFFLQIKSGLARWYVKVSLCVCFLREPDQAILPWWCVSKHIRCCGTSSSFANIFQFFVQILSTKTFCLVENAVFFVFRHILKKLLCDICRGHSVTDALTATFDQSSHLLKLKKRGGLMIPYEGTARVVRSAEHLIHFSLPT